MITVFFTYIIAFCIIRLIETLSDDTIIQSLLFNIYKELICSLYFTIQ